MKFLLVLSILVNGSPTTITKVTESYSDCEYIVKQLEKTKHFVHGACVKMEFVRNKCSGDICK